MARWTASAKWAVGPALDVQCAMLLGLALSEGLGRTLRCWPTKSRLDVPWHSISMWFECGDRGWCSTTSDAFRALRGLKN